MAAQRHARGMFGMPPAIGGRSVEIVHPVGNGMVDQRVDHLLVDLVAAVTGAAAADQRMQPYPSSDTRSPVLGLVR